MNTHARERHVLLVTYGEPPTPSFLDHLVYSWRILLGLTRMVADIPRPLLPMIALARGLSRNHLWKQERYGSPLETITENQAVQLAETLCRLAPATDWRVHVAYEFRDPSIPVVLERIPDDAPVDFLPMYVADSAFTHEISRTTLRDERDGRARSVSSWRVQPALPEEALADASVAHLRRQLASLGRVTGKDWALVLATHGTLLEPKRKIETGRVATERICRLIAERVRGEFGYVVQGWLNHNRGGRWTEPAMDVALRDVAERGFEKVVYFPCGFLADNAESQLEGRTFLAGQSGLEAVHIDCLNDAPELIELLARQVIGAQSLAPPATVRPSLAAAARP